MFTYSFSNTCKWIPIESKKNWVPKTKRDDKGDPSEIPKKKRRRRKKDTESIESDPSDIGEAFEMDLEDSNIEPADNSNAQEEDESLQNEIEEPMPDVDIKIEEICEEW